MRPVVRESEPVSRPMSSVSFVTSGPVFSINLIRHQTLSLRVRRTLAYLGLGYLLANAVALVVLLAVAATTSQQIHRTRVQLTTQAPSASAVEVVRREMETVQQRATEELARLQAMVSQQQQRFPVGGKLAALARTVPPRTWITGLSGARKDRTLTIRAAYLVDPDQPHALPTKGWLEALRADAAFGPGLKRLEMASSTRTSQGRAELFTFELVAEWNPVVH